jgi:hypothetical protein
MFVSNRPACRRRNAVRRAAVEALELRQLLTASPSTSFDYTGAVQPYSVPFTGTYSLSVAGAQGGIVNQNATAADGAVLSGDLSLTAGTTLEVVVGGEGTASGGGGGSFVYISGADLPLIAAGGGGGEGEYGNGDAAQTGEMERGHYSILTSQQ